ncbi:MAG: hypothetical protein QG656_2752, partial [Candidatus Hydrogenedentes bacterium]|nr:hypothetical protein [Candidatus Hydrogenedentota bacterium]
HPPLPPFKGGDPEGASKGENRGRSLIYILLDKDSSRMVR